MASAMKQVAVASKCLAIVMEKVDNDQIKRKNIKDPSGSSWRDNGYKIFQEFQEENRVSYWNPALVESVNSVDYVGFVRPGTLFVTGAELHLECLRGAWARRVLKPPSGFIIKSLGDVGGIEMQEVPQTQFIPLPEVLCLIVSGLNRVGQPATLISIIETLQEEYTGMTIPKEEILYSTLGGLMAEGKLFCMGDHYFVPTPSMLQQYHQAFLMRRPTMMWSHDDPLSMFHRQMLSKQQEVCSRECQTGASIANGIPPYKPPSAVGKKDQASSAKLQRDNNNANGAKSSNNLRKSAKEQKGEQLKSEKPGFLARLFRRPESKNREEKDAIIQKSQNSPTSQQSGSSNGLQNPPPLATFSAQFPPPEWLYDPRYFKQSSKTAAQNQQHLFAKIRKSSKDANGNRALKDDWNNVWLDLDPRGGFKRDQTDSRFVSQRHVTCPENLVKGGQWSPKHDRVRSRQKPRLSKYLSSSSECINYLGCPRPADHAEVHHYKEPKKHHRSKHPTKLNLHNYQMTNLEKFPVTEPFNENVLRNETKKKSAPPTPMTPTALSVPIVITTSIHCDTVPDFGAKTSTPAVSPISCKSQNRTPYRNVNQNCQDDQIANQQQVLNMVNENRDSAISSTSPVITEMSSSDAKYSSWSGSDGHQELQTTQDDMVQPPNTLDHTYINVDKDKETVDHSYVNDNLENIDHTYENLSKVVIAEQVFDGTQFENLSIDEENVFINKNGKLANINDNCPINNNNNNVDDINCVKIRPTYISAV